MTNDGDGDYGADGALGWLGLGEWNLCLAQLAHEWLDVRCRTSRGILGAANPMTNRPY